MSYVSLSQHQIDWIVSKIGISDPKKAVERFAELMMLEGIAPSDMSRLVRKMMQRERKK